MKPTVLLTGATGFVGSHVLNQLLATNHNVIALVRNASSLPEADNLKVMEVDLTDAEKVRQVLSTIQDCTVLCHLAAYMPPSQNKDDASISIEQNVIATVNILNALPSSIQFVCFASTVDVYGIPKHDLVTLQHPTQPRTYYGATKLAAEHYVRVFCEAAKKSYAILRYSHMFGPGDKTKKVIPEFIRAASQGNNLVIFGEGQDTRDFIYVKDAAQATVRIIDTFSDKEVKKMYHIANGTGISIKELAETVSKFFSVDIDKKPQSRPMSKLAFDISNLQEDIQYAPQYSLDQGIKETIEHENHISGS